LPFIDLKKSILEPNDKKVSIQLDRKLSLRQMVSYRVNGVNGNETGYSKTGKKP